MVETSKRYFSGRNVGQAVLAAAEELSLPPELVAYETVEGRHTSLKGTRRVVIAVDPQAPARVPARAPERPPERAVRPQAAGAGTRDERPGQRPGQRYGSQQPETSRAPSRERDPAAEAPPRQPAREPRSDAEHAAVAAMKELVALCGLDLDIEADERPAEMAIELSGPDRRLAVGRHGEVLRSFEHLLPRLLAADIEVRVDSGGFRARQDDQLRRLANEACDEVGTSGEAVLLDSYSPPERRVIHLVVQERAGLESSSEGDGFLKRVRISPAVPGPDADQSA